MSVILLKFEGGSATPKGESAIDGHEEWLTAHELHYKVTLPVQWNISGGERTVGQSNHFGIEVFCESSQASPLLLQASCVGTNLGECTIHIMRHDGTALTVQQEIKLQKCVIANFEQFFKDQSAGRNPPVGAKDRYETESKPVDHFIISYTKIDTNWTVQKEDVSNAGKTAGAYNLETAKSG